jgi:uncharacterized membrane protein YcaP (DUF421 family)
MEFIDDILGLSQHDLEWYQMMIRAVVVFFIALALIRIAGMRAFGSRTPFDTVLTITIGALLSRCISGHYPLFACLLAAFTLAIVTRLVAMLSYKFQSIRKLTEGDAVLIFDKGMRNEDNLRKFAISQKDLDRSLRENNAKDFSQVESMWYEVNGKITVVKKS